jgi:hypothetical protein
MYLYLSNGLFVFAELDDKSVMKGFLNGKTLGMRVLPSLGRNQSSVQTLHAMQTLQLKIVENKSDKC